MEGILFTSVENTFLGSLAEVSSEQVIDLLAAPEAALLVVHHYQDHRTP